MKRPLVISLTVLTAFVSLISRGLATNGLAVSAGGVASTPVIGGILLNLFALGVAVLTLWAVANKPKRAYTILLLFPVFGFLIYPLQNALVAAGYYPPRPFTPNNQLWGAAIAELFRYIWCITLFVWLRLSKNARAFLTNAATEQILPAASSSDT